MKLNDLFKVVSDQQEVRLIGDGFDEVTGFKTTLECILNDVVLNMRVDCVEAGSDCDLKVWVKAYD